MNSRNVRATGVVHRVSQWPSWRWKLITAGSAAIGGALFGGLAYGAAPPRWGSIWGFTVGVAGVLVGVWASLLLFFCLRLIREFQQAETQSRELAALVNLRPLSGSLPLDLGGWAADPILADTVLRLMSRTGASKVVECGSGWSTMLVASYLRETGGGRVLSFDHSQVFADRTRELLRQRGVSEFAEVIVAPIEDRVIDGRKHPWYGPAADGAVDDKIDLLLVDGPPADVARRSRYPAVPLLREYLAPQCLIVLDDGFRDDEVWIAETWGRELGAVPRLIQEGRGIWIIEMDRGADEGENTCT